MEQSKAVCVKFAKTCLAAANAIGEVTTVVERFKRVASEAKHRGGGEEPQPEPEPEPAPEAQG